MFTLSPIVMEVENYPKFIEFDAFSTVDGRNPAPVEVGSLSQYLRAGIWIYFYTSDVNNNFSLQE